MDFGKWTAQKRQCEIDSARLKVKCKLTTAYTGRELLSYPGIELLDYALRQIIV